MAITLVMMAAVVNLFANVGESVRNRRATLEMSGTLRMVRTRLQKDLSGATCDGIPKSHPGDNDKADGYIEIVEGPWSDKNPSILTDLIDDPNNGNPELDYATSQVPSSNAQLDPGNITDGRGLGDYDDILALTVRSEDEPFVGRGLVQNSSNVWIPGQIESTLAEVVWYAVEDHSDEPGMRTVYRRALLIAPWVNLSGISQPSNYSLSALRGFYSQYDISVHIEEDPPGSGTYRWVPNTLSDLIKRENRFGHYIENVAVGANGSPYGFPHHIDQTSIRFPFKGIISPLRPLSGERKGEDLMLNDVLAFDVRVFDPEAQLIDNSGTIAEPSDAGWRHTHPIVGYGAYVDLGYWGQYMGYAFSLGLTVPSEHPVPTVFSDDSSQKSHLAALVERTFDTWSFHYENDGLDTDNLDGDNNPYTGIDEGTNGLDDIVPYDTPPSPAARDGVDDIGERETMPPYDVPLRGIQVKLRIYESDSRQIRETSVIQSFQ